MRPHTRVRLLGAVCATLVWAGASHARPSVEESVKAVESLVKDATAAPAARRAELLAESIKARRELIALGVNDDRCATWLLDQAGAILEQAGWDGAEFSVLYGVPTGEQRVRVREAAAEAGALVDRADAAAAASVSRMEEALFAARGDAAGAKAAAERIEGRMSLLTDVEQAWRAPMIRSRAALLAAAALDGQGAQAEQRKIGKMAADALERLRAPDSSGEGSRLLWLATAQMLAGDRLAAAHRFAEVEAAARAGGRAGGDGMAGEQARLGLAGAATDLVGAREAARLLERGSAEAPLALDLLRSEAAARAVLAHAPDGESREAVQREAMDQLGRVVVRSMRLGVDSPAHRLTVEKAAALLDGGAGWAAVNAKALTPEMAYARGVALLGGGGREANEAGSLLARVVEGRGSDEVRAAALWAIGTRPEIDKSGPAARLDAAGALVRVWREFPSFPSALEALQRAETLVRDAPRSKLAGALKLQREAIGALLERTPGSVNVDGLRSVLLLNYATDESATLDAPALERLLTTAAGKRAGGDDSSASPDAQNAWIVIERSRRAAAGPERERVARVGAAWAIANAPALSARARLAWGEALLEAGEAQASVEQILAMGPIEKAALSQEERVRAQLALGRAQRTGGDPAAAFATLRTLTDSLDHDPTPGAGAPKRETAFWSAWAEMLEILHDQNKDGGRTPTIRLQLNRLRLIDSQLGGEPWKGRMERVQQGIEGK